MQGSFQVLPAPSAPFSPSLNHSFFAYAYLKHEGHHWPVWEQIFVQPAGAWGARCSLTLRTYCTARMCHKRRMLGGDVVPMPACVSAFVMQVSIVRAG